MTEEQARAYRETLKNLYPQYAWWVSRGGMEWNVIVYTAPDTILTINKEYAELLITPQTLT